VSAVARVFLLSPAHCGGERARLLFDARARFDLARRLHGGHGPSLGEVFAFLSGLYFRGKLTYALAFARPPAGGAGLYVITPCDGLCAAEEPVDVVRLRRFAAVDIATGDPRYHEPLARDAGRLAAALDAAAEVVLLGSVATGKYVEPLTRALGDRLRFPAEFVGRGDMSRGGLLLRAVRSGVELAYVPVAGAARRGARPARLEPVPRLVPPTASRLATPARPGPASALAPPPRVDPPPHLDPPHPGPGRPGPRPGSGPVRPDR